VVTECLRLKVLEVCGPSQPGLADAQWLTNQARSKSDWTFVVITIVVV
jgi:hypothetical protein